MRNTALGWSRTLLTSKVQGGHRGPTVDLPRQMLAPTDRLQEEVNHGQHLPNFFTQGQRFFLHEANPNVYLQSTLGYK
jgi:hypothetical protein